MWKRNEIASVNSMRHTVRVKKKKVLVYIWNYKKLELHVLCLLIK